MSFVEKFVFYNNRSLIKSIYKKHLNSYNSVVSRLTKLESALNWLQPFGLNDVLLEVVGPFDGEVIYTVFMEFLHVTSCCPASRDAPMDPIVPLPPIIILSLMESGMWIGMGIEIGGRGAGCLLLFPGAEDGLAWGLFGILLLWLLPEDDADDEAVLCWLCLLWLICWLL